MKRILIIEDQKPVRESIGQIFEFAGCVPRLISDGQAAFEELLASGYDLVTLDLNMPSLDGLSLLEALRSQDGPNHNTPIIVISAYLTQPLIDTLRQLGIRHFLSKPFAAEDLLDPARELLGLA